MGGGGLIERGAYTLSSAEKGGGLLGGGGLFERRGLIEDLRCLHHFFPHRSLSLLCNKLSACFDQLERSRDAVY